MKTVALVDPLWTGHHPTYLRFFSQVLLQLGQQVIVFCREPAKLADMVRFSSEPQRKNWQAIPYAWSPERSGGSFWAARATSLRRLQELNRLLTEMERQTATGIDLVFFCLLDDFIGHLQTTCDFDRCFDKPYSGLYFLPFHLRLKLRYAWARRGPLNPDAALLSRHCRSVGVLDEGIALKLSQRVHHKPVVCFPDVTDEECSTAPTDFEIAIRAKANGRRIVGLFGWLGKHKGVLEFMQHVAALQGQPVFFVVVGTVGERSFTAEENRMINDWMDNPPENVFAAREFIPDERTYNSLVRACDLLYAVYQRFPHSANVLAKAACMGVPVVVSDRYLMAERVKRFHLGFTVREDVPADFRALLESSETFAYKTGDVFRLGCRAYLKEHGLEKLAASFEQVLRHY